jgi:hypothetical protein
MGYTFSASSLMVRGKCQLICPQQQMLTVSRAMFYPSMPGKTSQCTTAPPGSPVSAGTACWTGMTCRYQMCALRHDHDCACSPTKQQLLGADIGLRFHLQAELLFCGCHASSHRAALHWSAGHCTTDLQESHQLICFCSGTALI